jgi:WD40 repeat protein
MLDPAGEPHLLDFGLARRFDDEDRMTQDGSVLGTPAYLAPEVARGRREGWSAAADQYALGVVLYELLTDQPPFAGPPEVVLALHQVQEPERPGRLNPAVPADLEAVCLKCLAKDPAGRYPDCAALAEDLRRWLGGRPTLARPVGQVERSWRWCRRNPVVASLTAAVFVLLLAGTGISTYFAIQEKAAAAWARRLQYDADMYLADQLWESEDGSAAAVRDLLLAHVPRDGREDLRDFAWRYQWRLLRDGVPTFRGHLGRVNAPYVPDGYALRGVAPFRGYLRSVAVAFAPDGHLVTLDAGRVVRHWDHASRRPTRAEDFRHLEDLVRLGHIGALALSADGRPLAVALRDGSVHRVDLATGHATPLLRGLPPVVGLTFAPGGRVLAAVGADRLVRLCEVATGREVQTIPQDEWRNTGFVSSPDGSALIAANCPRDDDVTTFRAGSEPVRRHYEKAVLQVACSPDGRLAALGLLGGQVVVWDVPTGTERWRWNARDALVMRLEFSPDSSRMATGGADGRVTVWDLASQRRTFRAKGHTAAVTSLAFAADGNTLASGGGDGTAKLWDLNAATEGRPLDDSQGRGTGVAYSPDGRWLATGGRAGAWLWDARTGRPVRELPVKGVTRLAFSPDSRTLATGGANQLVPVVGGWDYRVRLWDVATGGQLREFQGPALGPPNQRAVGSLAFSPDGSLLAAGFGSPSWLKSNNDEQVVRVWDVRSAREVQTLPVWNPVPALAFSPDGRTLAAACIDGRVRLRRWVVGTWHELPPLTGVGQLHCVAFSPDGKTLAAGTGNVPAVEVQWWDVATGREKPPLRGHTHKVVTLAFSPDGKTLASGSEDETVRLWDVSTGRALRTLRGQADGITDAAFSPDGTTLATGSNSMAVRLWEAASPEAVAAELAEDRARKEQEEAFERDERARVGQRRALLAEDYRRGGFLQDWLILAPIPLAEGETGAAGVEREQLPGEAQLQPKEGKKETVSGRELVWKRYQANGAFIDFNGFLGRTTERSVAYAVCYFAGGAERADLELRVGSDDQAKVYLNGREVYKSLRPRGLALDQDP